MIVKKEFLISGIEKTTPNVTLFRFKATDGAKVEFTPGMFVMVYHRDQATGKDEGRAFSIASSPNSSELEFAISMIHGRFTTVLDTAKIGDKFYITGPHGQFKFNVNDKEKFLFLAGGTGIAPFLSMLRQMREAKAKLDAVMFYSVKFPSEIIAKQELDGIERDTGMKMVVTVTRPQPSDNWQGETGHVNADMVAKYVKDVTERDCYICGPPEFVKALKAMEIACGVDEKRISAEMWG